MFNFQGNAIVDDMVVTQYCPSLAFYAAESQAIMTPSINVCKFNNGRLNYSQVLSNYYPN